MCVALSVCPLSPSPGAKILYFRKDDFKVFYVNNVLRATAVHLEKQTTCHLPFCGFKC